MASAGLRCPFLAKTPASIIRTATPDVLDVLASKCPYMSIGLVRGSEAVASGLPGLPPAPATGSSSSTGTSQHVDSVVNARASAVVEEVAKGCPVNVILGDERPQRRVMASAGFLATPCVVGVPNSNDTSSRLVSATNPPPNTNTLVATATGHGTSCPILTAATAANAAPVHPTAVNAATAVPPPPQAKTMFDYDTFMARKIEDKKKSNTYRVFKVVDKRAAEPTRAEGDLSVWCGNDYLGMSRHESVTSAMAEALQRHGAGSGGTRSISGTCKAHRDLEAEMADLHGKDSALVFSSAYVANDATLSTLLAHMPGAVVFSDECNHASMIEGMRRSGARKRIFRHNDVGHLEELLKAEDPAVPKIVAFESLYSMSGNLSPMRDLCAVARRYNALTYVDEAHAVGCYGAQGGGITERDGLQNEVDVLVGTFAKGYGVVGGYIAASTGIIDVVRSYAPGFIFTTSLPPMVAAGALASVRHLRESSWERQMHQANAAALKAKLTAAGVPVLPSPTHIIPVSVGDARKATEICDELFSQHGIYVQAIVAPTVPMGTERLRVTPGPYHTESMMDGFVHRLAGAWKERCAPGAAAVAAAAAKVRGVKSHLSNHSNVPPPPSVPLVSAVA